MAQRALRPPPGPPGFGRPAITFPNESPRARAAFMLYLELPAPRDLKRLEGKQPEGPRGMLGKPFSLSMLRTWSWKYKWPERARNHDEQVMRDKEAALRSWKVDQHAKRLKTRAYAAEIERQMALNELTYPINDTTIDIRTGRPRGGMPRDMHEIEPRYLEIAARYIRDAGDSERADFADVMNGATEPEPQLVQVATEEQIAQLRKLVSSIPQVSPVLVLEGHVAPDGTVLQKAGSDVIEGEVVRRDGGDEPDEHTEPPAVPNPFQP